MQIIKVMHAYANDLAGQDWLTPLAVVMVTPLRPYRASSVARAAYCGMSMPAHSSRRVGGSLISTALTLSVLPSSGYSRRAQLNASYSTSSTSGQIEWLP